jgi:hypothetical protein
MTTRDTEALNECTEEARGGADPNDVLEHCPENLRPELRTAIALGQMPLVAPSLIGRARGRERLDAALQKEYARRTDQKKAS